VAGPDEMPEKRENSRKKFESKFILGGIGMFFGD
jgi:hypothetical protein